MDISFNPSLDLVYLCQALCWNTSLTTLDLSGLTFSEESIRALASSLVENRTLTSLALSATNLTEKWLSLYLTPAFKANNSVRCLDLSLNKLAGKLSKCTIFLASPP